MIHQPIYKKLKEIARAGQKTTYQEIAPLAGLPSRGSYMGRILGELLREICKNEYCQGRPLLSAVVVRKNSGMPGNGFFREARCLGVYCGDDDKAFWQGELHKVHEYWSYH